MKKKAGDPAVKKKAGDPASEEEGRKPACEEDGTPRQVHPGAHLRRSTALGRLVDNTGHHNSGNGVLLGLVKYTDVTSILLLNKSQLEY